MSNYLRLILPEANNKGENIQRGFSKFGNSQSAPQNRSIYSHHQFNTWEQVFFSQRNRDLLKQRILKEINGRISEAELAPYLDQAAGWYKWRYLEPGYGPSTPQEVQSAIVMINDLVVKRVRELYRAQRASTSRWLKSLHQPDGVYLERTRFDNDYDKSIEINLN